MARPGAVCRWISGAGRAGQDAADRSRAARLAAGAERVAPPVTAPWGDRNARVQAPDGLELTLFMAE